MGMHSTYTATHYKDLNIDWQARAVTRHGEDILLTPQEFALLQVLFDHRGQAVSRGDTLADAAEYFCVTEDFLRKAYALYREMGYSFGAEEKA